MFPEMPTLLTYLTYHPIGRQKPFFFKLLHLPFKKVVLDPRHFLKDLPRARLGPHSLTDPGSVVTNRGPSKSPPNPRCHLPSPMCLGYLFSFSIFPAVGGGGGSGERKKRIKQEQKKPFLFAL